ncbi:MAG: carboxypeptidase M32 [Opitutaceae bacterium]|nr:carboxypeptidase M32 [Opitutaceae bacterium]
MVSPSLSPYEQLLAKLRRTYLVETVGSVLSWDEQVNLPEDSAGLRADQLAVMAELSHEASTDPEIETLLRTLEAQAATLSPDQAVVVRLTRRDYDRMTKLPAAFVAEKARQSSAAYHAWAECRKKNDFPNYAPFLERHLALAKEEATLLGWGDRAYDYAIDKHDPGMTTAIVEALFAELKEGLLPLVREIVTAAAPPPDVFRGYPIESQRQFLREVTERLGFDYRRGRIDVSLHPFCGGAPSDVRMTTRFNEHAPLDSLFSSIHETGHGLYEQGLSIPDLGTPLGQSVGMGVHESQSRLWENQVSRGRAFWSYFEPRFRSCFPEQTRTVDSETLYRAINAVEPTLIRVDADEVTYNLHILLRFEIEQRLFKGSLAVKDLPATWNALSSEIVGLVPPNDTLGVLQDVHWSGGAFGYFPSYCIGNMMAAQLWYTALTQFPDLESDFARGDFSRLLGWLRTKIHREGRRFDTLALVQRVTGEPLSPRHLLRYLRERYLPLYATPAAQR